MPRSFLVKKPQSSKKPNYSRGDVKTTEPPPSEEDSLISSVVLTLPPYPLSWSPWPSQGQCSLSPSSISSSSLFFTAADRRHQGRERLLPPSPNLALFSLSVPPQGPSHRASAIQQRYGIPEPGPRTGSDPYPRTPFESFGNLEPGVLSGGDKISDFCAAQSPPLSRDQRQPEEKTTSLPPSIPLSLPILAILPGPAGGGGGGGGSGRERFECFDCHTADVTKQGQLCLEWQSKKCFSCKYCDKEYGSLGALKMHIRTHTLPCVCKLCGKAFSRPWLLQGHIRTHTGEKPFSCLHCSRAFADRSNLRAHQQTHSDVKKYQCASCSKTFSRISLLGKHQEAGCCPQS
ncbi:zinc finger protein SNAI2-like [Lampris incognitus]|uniref:zinc finger protein SNAI2-like n=1 Tax=Lampris incognitus TaxID=2546036 RepID=UPI0024B51FCF|nr:zinc finger protein SNAI2-like [Lampris incognitus]